MRKRDVNGQKGYIAQKSFGYHLFGCSCILIYCTFYLLSLYHKNNEISRERVLYSARGQ